MSDRAKVHRWPGKPGTAQRRHHHFQAVWRPRQVHEFISELGEALANLLVMPALRSLEMLGRHNGHLPCPGLFVQGPEL